MNLRRRLAAEALGTAFLLATVIGSGIMGERLADGNTAVALLANALATGAMLIVLIEVFGPVSGAHFNPVVTLVMAWRRHLSWPDAAAFVVVQIAAAFAGVACAHLMFGEDVFSASLKVRSGWSQWWSELVATFGLLMAILGGLRFRAAAVPCIVGAYITAAYWFTASTSFANPAVTLARAASNTFAGIRSDDAPMFILAQLAGAALAAGIMAWLLDDRRSQPKRPVM
jgi:glycerol uptake facilitator-like aquaporin